MTTAKIRTRDFLCSLKRVGALCLIAIIFASLTPVNQNVQAAPNTQLNYQARVLSSAGDLIADGNYHVEYKLYDAATGGANLWTETYTGANRVRVANGYVSVSLGSQTAFPTTIDWGEELWLTINIGGRGGVAIWDGEMNPRTQITAVPYAFEAGKVKGSTGSFTADELVQVAPSVIQSVSDTLAAIRLNQTGLGGLLQLQGSGSDVFTVAANGNTVVAGSVDINGSNLDIGSATQAGSLTFNDGSGNTFTLEPGTQSGNLSFTLPAADGTADQCLKTDGSGVLSFQDCGSGGGGGSTNDVIFQGYDAAGGTDVNTVGGVAVPWDLETRKDTGFTHDNAVNPSRVVLDEPGWYRVGYTVNSFAATNTRSTVGCSIRLNGVTTTTPTGSSYNYNRTGNDRESSVGAEIVLQTTAANEYYEVICAAAGGTGVNDTIAGQSWTLAQKLDEGGGGGGGGGVSPTDAFIQDGNAFAAPAVLGTTDANSLSFKTNDIIRSTITADGKFEIAGSNSIVDSRFYVQDSITVGSGLSGVVLGPYTFDADNDADEAAWTFASPAGAGLQATGNNRFWNHATADTPSGGMGPTSGQGGPGDGYVYTESSAPAVNSDQFTMTLNGTVDASVTDWEFDFHWNQRGNDNLAIAEVQTNENAAGWVTRGTYGAAGPDVATNGADVWNAETLDLSTVISGSSTQIRFLVTLGATGTSWNNDFGLDTITLRDSVSGFNYGDNLIEAYNTNASSDVDLLLLRSDVGTTGDAKFRVDSDGDVFADGSSFIGGGADIAEKYKTDADILPGDVVSFADSRTVTLATEDNRSTLAGVVSTDAGIILDSTVDGVPVGLSGRVPTRLSFANGPIEAGDYLTAGPNGAAVKAIDAGPVIGTAMQAAAPDDSLTEVVIDVFVALGYYQPELEFSIDTILNPTSLTAARALDFFKDADPDKKGTQLEVALASLQLQIDQINSSSGTVTIVKTESSVSVNFDSPRTSTPVIIATPSDFIDGGWRVAATTKEGFIIELEVAQEQDVNFNWSANNVAAR